jgi:Tol biopolymer transport system component/predicted Ser/Thr protein kinase
MKPERWQQIDKLLEQALEQEPSRRSVFLDGACAGDEELRREVESLLAAHERAGSALSSPPLAVTTQKPLDPLQGLIGQRIGHYQIVSRLGEGGMGIVYNARDTHLDRFVAIKVLPHELVADPDRKRRFVKEAKAASSLNHPNIITVHDIASENGRDFIVMEYVEGKTLGQLIPRRGLKLSEVLKYAIQIADALGKAHAAGIIHRDLKPGNIMVGEGGLVKVLDFGLAKLTERPQTGKEESTGTLHPQTEEGMILGTASYMSPEQAAGKPVDARSDIFTFGSVLYEMITGQRAFQGDSKMSTLAAILNQEPKPATQISRGVPHELEKIIKRCLRKDPERRFQNMADVKVALKELVEEGASGELAGIVKPAQGNNRRVMIVSGLSACLVALTFAIWLWRPFRESGESHLTAIPLTTYPGDERFPSFSPDGNQVAFCWNGEKQDNFDIYVKQSGEERPSRLTSDPADDVSPAWSPDGRTIAFLRRLSQTSQALILIPQRGGRERTLAELDISGVGEELEEPCLAWTPDSRWVVSPVVEHEQGGYALHLFSVETDERRKLTNPASGIVGDTTPAFSSDGRYLSFARHSNLKLDIYLLRLTDGYLPDGEPERVPLENPVSLGVAWMPDGREIVVGSGTVTNFGLWRMAAFKPAMRRPLDFAQENASAPAISRQGNRLAYSVRRFDPNIWRVDLTGAGKRSTSPVRFISSTRADLEPAFSRDGTRIAFTSDRSGAFQIWVCASDGSNPIPLTSLKATMAARGAKWSPDGKTIAFYALMEGNTDVYLANPNGGMPRRLTTDPSQDKWPCWSRDGQSLYFSSDSGGTFEIWKMGPMGGKPVQITPNANGADLPHESPDGRFVYYSKGYPNPQSVWRVPADGGEGSKILDAVSPEGLWTVGNQGIYFFSVPDKQGYSDICLYEFATGKTRKLLRIERPVSYFIEASPDGRTILFPQMDESGSDLMLVENFR